MSISFIYMYFFRNGPTHLGSLRSLAGLPSRAAAATEHGFQLRPPPAMNIKFFRGQVNGAVASAACFFSGKGKVSSKLKMGSNRRAFRSADGQNSFLRGGYTLASFHFQWVVASATWDKENTVSFTIYLFFLKQIAVSFCSVWQVNRLDN